MDLERALDSDKTLRTIGFDDEPFERGADDPVGIAGIVCKNTSFDGMVWTEVAPDGEDATDRICDTLESGKFLPQLHAVLLDGIALAGFNVVDLPGLAERLDRPCVAIMRNRPDLNAIEDALQNVDGTAAKIEAIRRAGPIRRSGETFFQVHGCEPETARRLVDRVTTTGHVPEPIRIAHLVATAVGTGESGRRA